MSSYSMSGLVESVYSYFLKSGHQSTAESFAKEAKLDKKKLKSKTPFDLEEIFTIAAK